MANEYINHVTQSQLPEDCTTAYGLSYDPEEEEEDDGLPNCIGCVGMLNKWEAEGGLEDDSDETSEGDLSLEDSLVDLSARGNIGESKVVKEEARKCKAKAKRGETRGAKSESESRMLQKTVLSCWGLPNKTMKRKTETAVTVRQHVRSVNNTETILAKTKTKRLSGGKQLQETEAEFESRKCASALEVKQLFEYTAWARK